MINNRNHFLITSFIVLAFQECRYSVLEDSFEKNALLYAMIAKKRSCIFGIENNPHNLSNEAAKNHTADTRSSNTKILVTKS